MNMTAQNKLHLTKPNAQTVWDGFGVGGLDSMSEQLTGWLVKYTEWSSSGCVVSRGTAVEWVKRSQSRNCSLNMCHTLKCWGKHPYAHQYDEEKSPKPKLWSLYFCYRGEEKKILENKNKTQNREGRKTPDITLNAEKMNCTSWVRHSGTGGYFLELDFYIQKYWSGGPMLVKGCPWRCLQ